MIKVKLSKNTEEHNLTKPNFTLSKSQNLILIKADLFLIRSTPRWSRADFLKTILLTQNSKKMRNNNKSKKRNNNKSKSKRRYKKKML